VKFLEDNRARPFFLYFATHDIHVPRVPNQRFVGKTDMGARGDAIVELDWSIGRVLDTLDRLKLTRNTLFIFTSDNGPVVDDGYRDQAVERLGSHKPAGPLRGGKYSAFDGGTRVPFVVRWPGTVKPGVSDAPVSQVDLLASFASLAGQKLPETAAPDSFNLMPALLGKTRVGRPHIVEHATALSLIVGDWKVIQPRNGVKRLAGPGTETGNDPEPQLFDLAHDLGEQNNLAAQYPERVKEMLALLEKIQKDGPSRPR
jgi:arylsulfatase A-like enzyme